MENLKLYHTTSAEVAIEIINNGAIWNPLIHQDIPQVHECYPGVYLNVGRPTHTVEDAVTFVFSNDVLTKTNYHCNRANDFGRMSIGSCFPNDTRKHLMDMIGCSEDSPEIIIHDDLSLKYCIGIIENNILLPFSGKFIEDVNKEPFVYFVNEDRYYIFMETNIENTNFCESFDVELSPFSKIIPPYTYFSLKEEDFRNLFFKRYDIEYNNKFDFDMRTLS